MPWHRPLCCGFLSPSHLSPQAPRFSTWGLASCSSSCLPPAVLLLSPLRLNYICVCSQLPTFWEKCKCFGIDLVLIFYNDSCESDMMTVIVIGRSALHHCRVFSVLPVIWIVRHLGGGGAPPVETREGDQCQSSADFQWRAGEPCSRLSDVLFAQIVAAQIATIRTNCTQRSSICTHCSPPIIG